MAPLKLSGSRFVEARRISTSGASTRLKPIISPVIPSEFVLVETRAFVSTEYVTSFKITKLHEPNRAREWLDKIVRRHRDWVHGAIEAERLAVRGSETHFNKRRLDTIEADNLASHPE